MTHKQRLLALFCTVPGLFACLPAMAQPTLYLGMNGGTMERLFSDNILPRFEKANDVKVVIVPGTSADILAKVQATPNKPSIHVMVLDDGIMYRAIGMGLCSTLKPNPTLAQLPEKALIKDKAAAVSLGVTGLAYNSRLFKEKGWAAPTSWNDLADPRFKDKVVFQSMASSTFGLHGFLMYNRLHGGTDIDVNPGFAAWKQNVGPNVLEYIPNSAKLSEMVQTDEAALFPLTPHPSDGTEAQRHPGGVRSAQGRRRGAQPGRMRHRQQRPAGACAKARRIPAEPRSAGSGSGAG